MPLFFQLALAFAVGGFLGWLIGRLAGKQTIAPADNRLEEELRGRLQQREQELNSARGELSETTAKLAAALAKSDTTREFQEKAMADLRQTFQALSADALRQNNPQFLELAGQTFAKMQETAKGDLSTLVQPLREQLDIYQKRLQQSESAQSTTLGEVKKQLEGLAQNSQTLSTETLQLRRVLSSNQARGKWGEVTLRRVVEAAGMSPHCDFIEQTQVDDKKPDLIVRLPGDRVIIIDAKVPDLDFLRAIDAADPITRSQALTQHADRLKETIRELGKKNYAAQFSNALDYVVLFVPAESLFSAALEADHELILWAAQKQILIATPASLIGLLRAVSVSWQQHAQTENAREIAATAQELFARVAKFIEHFEKIRAGLERANNSYNDAVGSYERMVRPSGEKLLKLGGGAVTKDLPAIDPLAAALRLPPSG